MGGIQMSSSNFIVKSKIQNYSVDFIEDIANSLIQEIKKGDYIIIDRKIKNLHFENLKFVLKKNKFIEIDANELQKSYSKINPIIRTLIINGFKKNNRLIAIGGGITQDVTAFISSLLYRGVEWIFFPTSLLSQGDSCIGSKTSINFEEFKNQIGGFYPPVKVFIYNDFMRTLSDAEIKSGMGEMLHYFIISGKKDFEFYKKYYKQAFHDKSILPLIISKSLKIKKTYIEKDEFDQNIRQVFNYGHSFGHAIESLTKYEIPHGVAVSFGMDIANFMSVKLGFLNSNIRDEIKEVTDYICDGYKINKLNVNQFIDVLKKDKKNVESKLGLILAKGYGNIFKNLTEPTNQFRDWLEYYIKNESNTSYSREEMIQNDIHSNVEQLEPLTFIKPDEETIEMEFEICKNAVKNAVKIANKYYENTSTFNDELKDIKTIADLKINESILKDLSATNIPIVSEEIDNSEISVSQKFWIVDPLDGTYNFTRKFPTVGISIALFNNNIPLLGYVEDLFNNNTYYTRFQGGSYKNNNKISVSEVSTIDKAILATGFPSGTSYKSNQLLKVVNSIQEFKKIRALGSASLMMCYVAEGIFDVYYEKDIYLWDVAAGLALIKEAGGQIYFRKTGDFKYEVLASNKKIFKLAKEILIS